MPQNIGSTTKTAFPWIETICTCHEHDLVSIEKPFIVEPVPNELKSPESPRKKPQSSSSRTSSTPQNTIPRSLWDPFSRFPLEYLYFCEYCQSIKCPRCVDEEIVSHYCPVCLFEVTPYTARLEGNRCPRNCFKCPECMTAVNTRSVTGASSNSIGSEKASDKPSAHSPYDSASVSESAYRLTCTYCNWTSDNSPISYSSDGLSRPLLFKKGTYLFQQIQNNKERLHNNLNQRFHDLRMFYFQRSLEEGTRAALLIDEPTEKDSKNDLKSILLSRGGKAKTFAEVLEQRIQERNKNDTSAEIFSEIIEVDESEDQRKASQLNSQITDSFFKYHDNNLDSHLMDVDDVTDVKVDKYSYIRDVSSAQTIIRDDSDQKQKFPLPQPLRAKRIKRCSTCRHVVAKPDPKATSIKYKIRLMAYNYLPNLRLTEYPPKSKFPDLLQPGKPYTFLLTVTNPMQVNMKISLSTISCNMSDSSKRNDGEEYKKPRYPHKVTLITPNIELGADDGLWDETSLVKGVPSILIKRETQVSRRVEIDGARTFPSKAGIEIARSNYLGSKNLSPDETTLGVYQQGKNWCTVALEVVPSLLKTPTADSQGSGPRPPVLEIPLFVSFTFEVPNEEEEENADKDGHKDKKVEIKPETLTFGYWTVIGIGPIDTNSKDISI